MKKLGKCSKCFVYYKEIEAQRTLNVVQDRERTKKNRGRLERN